MIKGKILKGVGSFYTVYSYKDKKTYTLKARGIFRKKKIKPVIGDEVIFSYSSDDDGSIDEILPRKNELIRPSISNIDNIIIVCSIKHPDISYLVLDKMIINSTLKNTNLTVCFNKADLASEKEKEDILDIYKDAGINIIFTSNVTMEGIDKVKEILKGRVTTFMGVSAAGKSSLINSVYRGYDLETGIISEKIKRGKHTTRHCELFLEHNDTFFADTPGFSSLDVFDVKKEDLSCYYNEFSHYSGCKYINCVHINEPNCEIKKAVEENKINKIRYNNYLKIYNQLKEKENKY